MEAIRTALPGVLILEQQIYRDERGYFFEAFNQRTFNEGTKTNYVFVQDNQSESHKRVLRGLHFQVQKPQGKLVRVVAGEIFDISVDLRKDSPTFGQHLRMELWAGDGRMLWIPPGLAHGFLAVSEHAVMTYKTTEYWAPTLERTMAWNDPDLAIDWPLCGNAPILSTKDARGMSFKEAIKR